MQVSQFQARRKFSSQDKGWDDLTEDEERGSSQMSVITIYGKPNNLALVFMEPHHEKTIKLIITLRDMLGTEDNPHVFGLRGREGCGPNRPELTRTIAKHRQLAVDQGEARLLTSTDLEKSLLRCRSRRIYQHLTSD